MPNIFYLITYNFSIILSFFHFSEVPLIIPSTEVTPAPWWDAEADKSLLIGTYRYGYEQ